MWQIIYVKVNHIRYKSYTGTVTTICSYIGNHIWTIIGDTHMLLVYDLLWFTVYDLPYMIYRIWFTIWCSYMNHRIWISYMIVHIWFEITYDFRNIIYDIIDKSYMIWMFIWVHIWFCSHMISYMSIIYEVQVKFPTVFSRKPQRFTYDFSWPLWDSYFSWHVCCVCVQARKKDERQLTDVRLVRTVTGLTE